MKKNEWLLCPNCNNKTRIKMQYWSRTEAFLQYARDHGDI